MTSSSDPVRIRSILVIKLRAVGDVLLSTVVTPTLRHAYPGARIDFLTEPPSRDILVGNPYLDEVLIFNPSAMSGLDLIRMVRKRRYDLVIDLFGNPRTALVTRFSGAPYRVGFRFRQRAYAYNLLAEPRGGKVHNTQFNLDALELLNLPVVERFPQFRFSEEDDAYARNWFNAAFQGKRLIAGINTGGGWYTKRWGREQYAQLADRMQDELRAMVLLFWGPGQQAEVEALRDLMKSPAALAPPTTLKQLGAFLSRCDMVVSNDSGPMHIAAAVGTPVLGIYGPTNPALQGPFGDQHLTVRLEGLDCLGCNLTKCPIGNICMTDLTVQRVFEHVKALLVKNGLPAEGGPQ